MALIGFYLTALAVSLAFLVASTVAKAASPVLIAEVDIAAPPLDVWSAWASLDGLSTFFARHGEIGDKAGDPYEVWFLPDAPAGGRGSEGTRIIARDPGRLLSFEWAMPPYMEQIRPHLTAVTLLFDPRDAGRKTHVTLIHSGFGGGPDWERGVAYFHGVWNTVLSNLAYRFQNGPIDWSRQGEAMSRGEKMPWWRTDLVRRPD